MNICVIKTTNDFETHTVFTGINILIAMRYIVFNKEKKMKNRKPKNNSKIRKPKKELVKKLQNYLLWKFCKMNIHVQSIGSMRILCQKFLAKI